jgi:transcription elongation factor Elf1
MYTQGQFIAFIQKVFGSCKLSGTGAKLNANVVCPSCKATKGSSYSKQKLAIKIDDHYAKCWVCDYKSKSLYPLLKKYFNSYVKEYNDNFGNKAEFIDNVETEGSEENGEEEETKEEENDGIIKVPTGFVLLAEEFHNRSAPLHVRRAKQYLLNRGIEYKDFWYHKYGSTNSVEEYKDRVIIPSHDVSGSINYITARAIDKYTRPKYVNIDIDRTTVIFNEINIDWSNELMIVEGPLDLVKCPSNTTCLLGSSLTKQYALCNKIMQNQTPVLLALDPDATSKSHRIAKLLMSNGINIRVIQYGSIIKDIGSMTKEEVLLLINAAKPYNLHEDYLRYRLSML